MCARARARARVRVLSACACARARQVDATVRVTAEDQRRIAALEQRLAAALQAPPPTPPRQSAAAPASPPLVLGQRPDPRSRASRDPARRRSVRVFPFESARSARFLPSESSRARRTRGAPGDEGPRVDPSHRPATFGDADEV